ncbi:MAG: hypothetical protein ACK41V_23905, partial [Acidovorax sp.]|uniref:hypothetical protein n=1 Tax=Acidovorax sp. TaxID=1872122 RepID=UPI00391B8F54
LLELLWPRDAPPDQTVVQVILQAFHIAPLPTAAPRAAEGAQGEPSAMLPSDVDMAETSLLAPDDTTDAAAWAAAAVFPELLPSGWQRYVSIRPAQGAAGEGARSAPAASADGEGEEGAGDDVTQASEDEAADSVTDSVASSNRSGIGAMWDMLTKSSDGAARDRDRDRDR